VPIRELAEAGNLAESGEWPVFRQDLIRNAVQASVARGGTPTAD
jgi:hypothetical protein